MRTGQKLKITIQTLVSEPGSGCRPNLRSAAPLGVGEVHPPPSPLPLTLTLLTQAGSHEGVLIPPEAECPLLPDPLTTLLLLARTCTNPAARNARTLSEQPPAQHALPIPLLSTVLTRPSRKSRGSRADPGLVASSAYPQQSCIAPRPLSLPRYHKLPL